MAELQKSGPLFSGYQILPSALVACVTSVPSEKAPPKWYNITLSVNCPRVSFQRDTGKLAQ